MNNEIIQAYLWQEVIRLGFSPSSDKDRIGWLSQYERSLKDFWEIGDYPIKVESGVTTITHSGLNFEYKYQRIADISKFTISFCYLSNTMDLMWTHDVDNNYFLFPKQSILSKYQKLKQVKKEFKQFAPSVRKNIMRRISDGLLFHPAVHQHIDSPIDEHEMRIGGGIYNPFVFLFHLRYQLCPDEDKRKNEKERLAQLFEKAIISNAYLNANDLLKS